MSKASFWIKSSGEISDINKYIYTTFNTEPFQNDFLKPQNKKSTKKQDLGAGIYFEIIIFI